MGWSKCKARYHPLLVAVFHLWAEPGLHFFPPNFGFQVSNKDMHNTSYSYHFHYISFCHVVTKALHLELVPYAATNIPLMHREQTPQQKASFLHQSQNGPAALSSLPPPAHKQPKKQLTVSLNKLPTTKHPPIPAFQDPLPCQLC